MLPEIEGNVSLNVEKNSIIQIGVMVGALIVLFFMTKTIIK